MSFLSELPERAIVLEHVKQQFNRRGDGADGRFLTHEIAVRMAEKLDYMKISPTAILDVGCGIGAAYELLQKRYLNAQYTGIDFAENVLGYAKSRTKNSWWQNLVASWRAEKSPLWLCREAAQTGLESAAYDMLWSNLMLHWHPRPHDVLQEWARVLAPEGLLMFSGFGPNTCKEVRLALVDAGLSTTAIEFVDMHDFGDLLMQRGFAQPVMDQEILTLTYSTPESLLKDLYALGGNPSSTRQKHLLGKGAYQRLCQSLEQQRQADGRICLTIEVCYGHAWRAREQALSSANEFSVPLSAIRRHSHT